MSTIEVHYVNKPKITCKQIYVPLIVNRKYIYFVGSIKEVELLKSPINMSKILRSSCVAWRVPARARCLS